MSTSDLRLLVEQAKAEIASRKPAKKTKKKLPSAVDIAVKTLLNQRFWKSEAEKEQAINDSLFFLKVKRKKFLEEC